MPHPDDLLEEQIAYYRARAPEYDEWWFRQGRYELDGPRRAEWLRGAGELEVALDDFTAVGDVLELAAGTGLWTERLVRTAGSVTAVDASPEVLELNRRRVEGAGAPVTHVVADLFTWEPPRRFDVVFFSFWLSHVPPGRFEAFWDLVDRAVAPGGRVFLIDNAPPAPDRPQAEGGVSHRELADGRTFAVVKVHWTPEALRERLSPLGWSADLRVAAGLFLYGSAARG